jgi:hypothetical protein
MKHRLHNFSALLRCQPAGNIPATQQEQTLVKTAPRALAKWRGRAESPCQRAVPVQYSPRRQSRRRADSDRLKSLFHRPFRAVLIRGGSDAEGATFANMNEYKRNAFECCGAKLPGTWKACPRCQKEIPRREMTEKELCLRELDRMFRVNTKWMEQNAAANPTGAKTRQNRIAWISRFTAIIEGAK